VLTAFDRDSQTALLAHCASLSVNAVHEPWNRSPRRIAHADRLARAVNLDMSAAGWRPTVDNYFGRVPKARILEAVREAKGDPSVQLIDHLKKPDMAREATPGVGNSCNPDYSFWEAYTRTQWNPVPQLDIGLQVMYTHHNTAYKGPAAVAADGSRPAIALIDDQNIWSAMFRWQGNFYP
jgi:hypothetical protein